MLRLNLQTLCGRKTELEILFLKDKTWTDFITLTYSYLPKVVIDTAKINMCIAQELSFDLYVLFWSDTNLKPRENVYVFILLYNCKL